MARQSNTYRAAIRNYHYRRRSVFRMKTPSGWNIRHFYTSKDGERAVIFREGLPSRREAQRTLHKLRLEYPSHG